MPLAVVALNVASADGLGVVDLPKRSVLGTAHLLMLCVSKAEPQVVPHAAVRTDRC